MKRRRRGEGSVRFVKDRNLYCACKSRGFSPDGTRVRVVTYGTTEQEALDKLQQKLDAAAVPLEEKLEEMSGDRDWLSFLAGFEKGYVAGKSLKNRPPRIDLLKLFFTIKGFPRWEAMEET